MILNLTQHAASPEQLAAGVVDLPEAERAFVSKLLTFDKLPTRAEIAERAAWLAQVAGGDSKSCPSVAPEQFNAAMVGGAPWLMSALEDALNWAHIEAVYAFSVRESVEQAQPDGSVRKTAVFRHVGFV